MGNKTVVLVVVVCAIGLPYFGLAGNHGPSQYGDFAKCLKSKGISVAGTDTCPSCQQQKNMFGTSFRYLKYHNCEIEPQWCIANGITGYYVGLARWGEIPGGQDH